MALPSDRLATGFPKTEAGDPLTVRTASHLLSSSVGQECRYLPRPRVGTLPTRCSTSHNLLRRSRNLALPGFTLPSGEELKDFSGIITSVLVRQDDRWLIRALHKYREGYEQ